MNVLFSNTRNSDHFSVLSQYSIAAALAAALVVGPSLNAAQAEISIGLGGLGGVSLGLNDGVQANAHVGGVTAGATVGGSSIASASANVGGTTGVSAGATVGGSTSVASVGASVGGTTPGTVTDVGTTPGVPVTRPAVVPVVATPAIVAPKLKKMPCAADGNSQVYNGMQVVDRRGTVVGWVNDTMLDQQLRIVGLRFQSIDKRCIGLTGGGYKVTSGVVAVNMDASRLR